VFSRRGYVPYAYSSGILSLVHTTFCCFELANDWLLGKIQSAAARANSACRHRSRSHNLPTRVIGDLGTRRTRQGTSRIAKCAPSFAVADYMSPWSLKEDPLVELFRSPDAQAAGKISIWLAHSSPRIKTFSDPAMSKINARWEPLSRKATPVTALRYFKQSRTSPGF
jgi:hypothetical protein